MLYFDKSTVANSKAVGNWWDQVRLQREWFHNQEQNLAPQSLQYLQTIDPVWMQVNQAAVLPRDAWLEMDAITTRIMRDDEGQTYMRDLMPLAKPVNIGKMVQLTRFSTDVNDNVVRSMSGQVPVDLDKVTYDYRGTPVPIFAKGYGREWREWNTLQSENFNALSDDQEATVVQLNQNMAQYALDGDSSIVFEGYTGYGIRTNPLSKSINIGPAGANIDLTSSATTADAIDSFITQTLGAVLDANLITQTVNLYVSPEIGRRLDESYSGAGGFKGGKLFAYLETNRRINKISVTYELSGNEFFGFVPNSQYIRPLVGMSVNTTAKSRVNPTDNYQFLVMGAMGLEIRADANQRSGVFYSVSV